VDQSLAAVQAQSGGCSPDGVVGHGQEDQIRLVEHGMRLEEAARTGDAFDEAGASRVVAAGHGTHLPAGAGEGDRQHGTHPPCAHERDARPTVGLRVGHVVLVVLVVHVVLVVLAGHGRIVAAFADVRRGIGARYTRLVDQSRPAAGTPARCRSAPPNACGGEEAWRR
jgi:hypothetical protein